MFSKYILWFCVAFQTHRPHVEERVIAVSDKIPLSCLATILCQYLYAFMCVCVRSHTSACQFPSFCSFCFYSHANGFPHHLFICFPCLLVCACICLTLPACLSVCLSACTPLFFCLSLPVCLPACDFARLQM